MTRPPFTDMGNGYNAELERLYAETGAYAGFHGRPRTTTHPMEAVSEVNSAKSAELEGVHVDLSHPDLNGEDWESPYWWIWFGRNRGANLCFPTEAALGVEELRRQKGLGDDEEPLILEPGDRVTVSRVEIDDPQSRFDAPHDRQVRRAFIRVERQSGAVVDSPYPMTFYGVTRLRGAPLRDFFDRLTERVLRHNQISELYDRNPSQEGEEAPRLFWDMEFSEMALDRCRKASAAFFSLLPHLPEDGQGPGLERAHLRSLVNSAAAFGYLLAKHESREAEDRARKSVENARAASKRSAEVSRNKAWKEAAEKIWAENPSLKTNAVVMRMKADPEVVAPHASDSSVWRSINPFNPNNPR